MKQTANMKLVLLISLCCGVLGSDEYLSDIQQQCNAKSDFLSCGKFEAAKYVTKLVAGEPTSTIDGPLKFVTLNQTSPTSGLFPSARQMARDSEFRKIIKFAQRQFDAFLGSRALAFPLPDYAKLVDPENPNNEIATESNDVVEARGKHKKKKAAAIIVPLIMLFKLFKIKVLLALALFGIGFIKKALIFLFLVGPSYINMLKICKVEHHAHHIEEHPHDWGSTGYSHGHSGGGGGGHGGWGDRAYSAYKPQ